MGKEWFFVRDALYHMSTPAGRPPPLGVWDWPERRQAAELISHTKSRTGRIDLRQTPYPRYPAHRSRSRPYSSVLHLPTHAHAPSALALGRCVALCAAPLAGPKMCLPNHCRGWSAYSSVEPMGGLGERDPSPDSPPSCRSAASRSLRHSAAAAAVGMRVTRTAL